LETDPETLIATMLAPAPNTREEVLELCGHVTCPVLVLHGENDEMRPPEVGRQLAVATGGRFVPLEGCGHGPHLRKPVLVNNMLHDFVERAARPPPVGVLGLASSNLEGTRT
jgi:pimeloyl-ACP methyl ester carboxylesterase